MPVTAPHSFAYESLLPHRRQHWVRDGHKKCSRRPTLVALARTKEMADDQKASSSPDGPQHETLWLQSAGTWLLGALLPNLILASNTEQLLAMKHWQIGALLLGIDSIFVATSFKFLDLAGSFDRDWHKTLREYPGPAWGSAKGDARDSNQGSLPLGFRSYVKLFLGAGLLLPLSAMPVSYWLSDHGALTAAVLGPYLICLVVQVGQELHLLRQKSAQWPIVPVHHMYYRFLQFARGAFLVSALQGPDWLMWLIAGLASLWFFNAGAVMTWETSLYYYHRQSPIDMD